MTAPGRCTSCNMFVKERFPIIKRNEDCRPKYCRKCARKNNEKSVKQHS